MREALIFCKWRKEIPGMRIEELGRKILRRASSQASIRIWLFEWKLISIFSLILHEGFKFAYCWEHTYISRTSFVKCITKNLNKKKKFLELFYSSGHRILLKSFIDSNSFVFWHRYHAGRLPWEVRNLKKLKITLFDSNNRKLSPQFS